DEHRHLAERILFADWIGRILIGRRLDVDLAVKAEHADRDTGLAAERRAKTGTQGRHGQCCPFPAATGASATAAAFQTKSKSARRRPRARDQSAGDDEVYGLGAFAFLVGLDIERDALSFGQRFQSGPFDRGDGNEHTAPTVVGFDEAVATLSIEDLARPCHCHWDTPNPKVPAVGPYGAAARPDIRVRGKASAITASVTPPAPTGGGTSKPRCEFNLIPGCGKVAKPRFRQRPSRAADCRRDRPGSSAMPAEWPQVRAPA